MPRLIFKKRNDRYASDPAGAGEFAGAERVSHGLSPLDLPPELLALAEQAASEIKKAADELAIQCDAPIKVLLMRLTRTPPDGLPAEEIRLYFKGKPGMENVQKWYLPFVLRDLVFRYDPRDVLEVYTAQPRRLPESIDPGPGGRRKSATENKERAHRPA